MCCTISKLGILALRVCIATTAFPRWVGDDRGIFIFDAARAIQAQGAQVRVVAMHSPGAKTQESIDAIEITRPRYLIPERLEILQQEGGGLPIMWRTNRLARLRVLPFFLVQAAAIARLSRECDIIHSNWTLSAAAAWMGRSYHRRPIVVTVHGSDIFQAAKIPVIAQITRKTLTACDHIIAVGRSLAQATVQLGVSSQCIEVLPDGVDVTRYSPSTDRAPVILFVGSLIERKGIRYLLEAWSQIASGYSHMQLVLIGEGSQRKELEQFTRSLGLAGRVQFLGAQPPAQVAEWMRRAQLFVLPSVEEGLGVVLLEALASGTPCVATDVGGIPDVVTPDVGVLVPPRNPEALADAIQSILSHQEHWGELSAHARQRAVEQYSWEVIGARLMGIYRSVLARTR